MTLGELYDKLEEIRKATKDTADAMAAVETAIARAGPVEIERCSGLLQIEAEWLERLRNEEIKL